LVDKREKLKRLEEQAAQIDSQVIEKGFLKINFEVQRIFSNL